MTEIIVVDLTPYEKAKRAYTQAVRGGCKGRTTLREVNEAWYAFNALRDDEFGERLRSLGSLDGWKDSFKEKS